VAWPGKARSLSGPSRTYASTVWLSAATVVIEGEGNRVEVSASIYLGNLGASWQTWVLERTGTGWEVTGTTGPVSIS
jgi:hypothetical protein